MVSAWRNFENIFSRPRFTIIFRPEMLKFHPYSILTGKTMVEFVIYCVLNNFASLTKFRLKKLKNTKKGQLFEPFIKILINFFFTGQNLSNKQMTTKFGSEFKLDLEFRSQNQLSLSNFKRNYKNISDLLSNVCFIKIRTTHENIFIIIFGQDYCTATQYVLF